jgi:hypothetical protein
MCTTFPQSHLPCLSKTRPVSSVKLMQMKQTHKHWGNALGKSILLLGSGGLIYWMGTLAVWWTF